MVWVGRVLKDYQSQTPAMGNAPTQQLRLPRATSNPAVSTSRDGALTASLAAAPGPHLSLSEKFS